MADIERKRPPGKVSVGDFGRFFVAIRRGRVLASVFFAAAALLGLVMGVLRVPETVVAVAGIVFVATAIPAILLQAVTATRPPQDGREYAAEPRVREGPLRDITTGSTFPPEGRQAGCLATRSRGNVVGHWSALRSVFPG